MFEHTWIAFVVWLAITGAVAFIGWRSWKMLIASPKENDWRRIAWLVGMALLPPLGWAVGGGLLVTPAVTAPEPDTMEPSGTDTAPDANARAESARKKKAQDEVRACAVRFSYAVGTSVILWCVLIFGPSLAYLRLRSKIRQPGGGTPLIRGCWRYSLRIAWGIVRRDATLLLTLCLFALQLSMVIFLGAKHDLQVVSPLTVLRPEIAATFPLLVGLLVWVGLRDRHDESSAADCKTALVDGILRAKRHVLILGLGTLGRRVLDRILLQRVNEELKLRTTWSYWRRRFDYFVSLFKRSRFHVASIPVLSEHALMRLVELRMAEWTQAQRASSGKKPPARTEGPARDAAPTLPLRDNGDRTDEEALVPTLHVEAPVALLSSVLIVDRNVSNFIALSTLDAGIQAGACIVRMPEKFLHTFPFVVVPAIVGDFTQQRVRDHARFNQAKLVISTTAGPEVMLLPEQPTTAAAT